MQIRCVITKCSIWKISLFVPNKYWSVFFGLDHQFSRYSNISKFRYSWLLRNISNFSKFQNVLPKLQTVPYHMQIVFCPYTQRLMRSCEETKQHLKTIGLIYMQTRQDIKNLLTANLDNLIKITFGENQLNTWSR